MVTQQQLQPPASSAEAEGASLASVTEVAIVSVPATPIPSSSSSSTATAAEPQIPSDVTSVLSRAKSIMEEFTGHSFAYFRLLGSTTDKNVEVLIVGGWRSVAVHMDDWLPSEGNQALVRELGGLGATVPWMWHLGVERGVVERVIGGVEGESGESEALRVWRGVVADAEAKGEVEKMLRDLKEEVGEEGVVWGWRLDKGYYADEKSDMRAAVGVDAAEVVVFARVGRTGGAEQRALVDEVLKKLGGIAGHVDDKRALLLKM